MIPDEVVEQVRDAADIVQIVGEYVNLKRAGADFRGPCPFHQGTHRNFSVSPRKHMYYCFVCHEGGDVFRFLQKRLGVEWPQAVKMVGEKSGIEVREIDSRREGPDPREPLWEVNATAGAYFQKILWDDPLGAQARDYLAQRDITKEIAENFGIGFAPREIGLLRNYMATLGFDEQRQIAAGLLISGEEGSEPRPRFRGRLMFPILDSMGRNIGFGGRVLGPGEPKYLNSPESAAFSKGRTLYGLNWAKNDVRRE
ncbi:MAG TPA: CHC2 zinc finger domain-containing protein, partial [Gemmatimonadaceae bacterium]|nr:CHC2 zinc finger domain-containing protein [Gemmatimonadaceae bacterium]